ncbi:hypothetical protein SAMD00023353_0702130 [Rosellinia necatrix]|uniref:Uncharacterized protein n=1 Tax=Rosellinia necatrix TaxID=77044 RepID=A0A1S7UQJ4_ROSNE|nr:hypothetical protein SAMD00023353_0702130 [Rosellinia necatrix]
MFDLRSRSSAAFAVATIVIILFAYWSGMLAPLLGMAVTAASVVYCIKVHPALMFRAYETFMCLAAPLLLRALGQFTRKVAYILTQIIKSMVWYLTENYNWCPDWRLAKFERRANEHLARRRAERVPPGIARRQREEAHRKWDEKVRCDLEGETKSKEFNYDRPQRKLIKPFSSCTYNLVKEYYEIRRQRRERETEAKKYRRTHPKIFGRERNVRRPVDAQIIPNQSLFPRPQPHQALVPIETSEAAPTAPYSQPSGTFIPPLPSDSVVPTQHILHVQHGTEVAPAFGPGAVKLPSLSEVAGVNLQSAFQDARMILDPEPEAQLLDVVMNDHTAGETTDMMDYIMDADVDNDVEMKDVGSEVKGGRLTRSLNGLAIASRPKDEPMSAYCPQRPLSWITGEPTFVPLYYNSSRAPAPAPMPYTYPTDYIVSQPAAGLPTALAEPYSALPMVSDIPQPFMSQQGTFDIYMDPTIPRAPTPFIPAPVAMPAPIAMLAPVAMPVPVAVPLTLPPAIHFTARTPPMTPSFPLEDPIAHTNTVSDSTLPRLVEPTPSSSSFYGTIVIPGMGDRIPSPSRFYANEPFEPPAAPSTPQPAIIPTAPFIPLDTSFAFSAPGLPTLSFPDPATAAPPAAPQEQAAGSPASDFSELDEEALAGYLPAGAAAPAPAPAPAGFGLTEADDAELMALLYPDGTYGQEGNGPLTQQQQQQLLLLQLLPHGYDAAVGMGIGHVPGPEPVYADDPQDDADPRSAKRKIVIDPNDDADLQRVKR